jgi:hypothetical protein
VQISSRPHRLSEDIKKLSELSQNQGTTFRDLVHTLGSRSSLILSIFFSLPFCLPIPVPGLSCFLGTLIFFLGIWKAMGKDPWLPRAVLDKQVPNQLFGKIFNLGEKFLRRLESFVRPRLFGTSRPWMRCLNGLLIAYVGFLLALPYPPGTNFPPAANIILLSVGSLEEDGLVLLVGYVGVLFNTALFIAVTFFGVEGIHRLMHWD